MADRPDRENKEKDKIGGRGFTQFPKEGRKRCRVINLERSEQVTGSVNGINFVVQNNAIVDLHPSQIECLRNMKVETSEYEEDENGKFTVRPVVIPRVMVEVLGDAVMVESQTRDEKGKFKKVATPELPPAEQIPGLKSGAAVISGRG